MPKRRRLGRGVAIVGAGMSKFGMFKDRDSKDLFAEAFKEMLSSVDKGVDPKDIDALYLGNFSNDFFVYQAHWGPIISDVIGLYPKPATRTEGATKLDGPMPINTSGGLKCKGHPVGATGTSQLFEVWTQLRGRAGRRQVPKKNLRIGAAHNLGGVGGTCTFTILERR